MTSDEGSRQLEIERSAHYATRQALETSHRLLRDMETRLRHAEITISELRERLTTAATSKESVLPAPAKVTRVLKAQRQKLGRNKPVRWWEQNWRAKFCEPDDAIA
jgi:hypothetical protein